jgi:hypothetical protein
MKKEMEKDQRQINNSSESTNIFLLENSSRSRRRAHKSLQTYVILALVAVSIFSFSIPFVSYAQTAVNNSYTVNGQTGLVRCSGVATSGETVCNFQAFISMIGTVINWLFATSVPVAVALFAYAGLLYMSGKDSNKSKAKTIFLNVAIGFTIMLVAFVFVDTLVGWVANAGIGATTFLKV